MSDEPKLPPELLEELSLISSGKPLPPRPWTKRAWRPGEPAWLLHQGPGGDWILQPVRITEFNSELNVSQVEGEYMPHLAWTGDLRWPGVKVPDAFVMRGVLPREVPGEEW